MYNELTRLLKGKLVLIKSIAGKMKHLYYFDFPQITVK